MSNSLKPIFFATLCGAYALAMAAPAAAGPSSAAGRDVLGGATSLVTSVHYTGHRHHHHFGRHRDHHHPHHHRY